MITVKNIEVYNIYNAIIGARNPLESWGKSDSWPAALAEDKKDHIGPKDLKLMQKLVLAGDDHGKFMRQIVVSMDITTSLYFFKEFDTYKVGTVANSESTMHKLADTPITRECFSFDYELDDIDAQDYSHAQAETSWIHGRLVVNMFHNIINDCELLRKKYLETKDIRYWRALIQLLPCGWNQKRTWTANYQVLRNMYFARRNHKLQEWRDLCKIIEELPFGKELICIEREILKER